MKKIPVRKINTAIKGPGLAEDFSIRDLRNMFTGTEMVQELHRHDFFYMLALEKGSGSHEIDFTPYEVSGNTVFFMRPGQVHQLRLKKGSTGYLVAFKADFYYPHDKAAYQLLGQAGNMNHAHFDPGRFKKLLSVLAYIFEEYTGQQERYREMIKANLDILFIELLRHSNKSLPDKANAYTQERLEELSALLKAHISTHKQVSMYAEMLNLSAYQLNAITKETLGKTCSALINEYIILEAKRYLLATSNQVNQVADQLGYEDVSYFIRFFKKHTGYTPEAFRHNFK